jgi:hypothetical protein
MLMISLLTFLIIIGLFFYFIWFLFFRSLLWVAEPLIEYFESRETGRLIVEDDSGVKAKVTLEGLDKPIHLPKSILKKAEIEPQKLPNTTLWIYKDYIFSSKPTEEKLKEIFEEGT